MFILVVSGRGFLKRTYMVDSHCTLVSVTK